MSSHTWTAIEGFHLGFSLRWDRKPGRQLVLQNGGRRKKGQAVLILNSSKVHALEKIHQDTAKSSRFNSISLLQKLPDFSFHIIGTHLILVGNVCKQNPHRSHDG